MEFQILSYPTGIPLLQYADYTIFFMESSVEEVIYLSMLLICFADCLGLQINFPKLVFSASDCLHEKEILCSRALGMSIKTLPMHYLGYHCHGADIGLGIGSQ